MPQVLFTAFSNRLDATHIAERAKSALAGHGVTSAFTQLDVPSGTSVSSDTLVVSLGGDGTFLRSAHLAHGHDARILAVNLGRVGFLLDVPADDVVATVLRALSSNDFVERLALEIQLEDGRSHFAMNEVVVERKAAGHMVRVTTFVDNEEFFTYSADGVMVSTPTGSTGYNFSAGGPLVEAELPAMIVTPVAAHFTIDRSIVVGEHRTIRLRAESKPAVVVADSHVIGELSPDQSVTIRRSPRAVRVVRSPNFDMGVRLRASLREGHA